MVLISDCETSFAVLSLLILIISIPFENGLFINNYITYNNFTTSSTIFLTEKQG